MTSFLSIRASQVIIEPWDPAVNKARQQIDSIDPSLLKNVKKIIVHPGGGSGQLGHVEMGQGKDPQEVHLFKDRIKQHVVQNAGQLNRTLTPQELEQAIVNGLMETLSHEAGHIGKTRTLEQIIQGPFLGEPEAEGVAREIMHRQFQRAEDAVIEASYVLDEMREKLLPNYPVTEPDIEFLAFAINGDKRNMIKKGISLLNSKDVTPAILDIEKAKKFNKDNIYKAIKKIGLVLYAINTNSFNDNNFIINLACWQAKNNIKPTGMLDKDTIEKFSDASLDLPHRTPRNFATVIPGILYRGGIIDNVFQLQYLKDMGVERVVSLHANSRIPKMCGSVGIEYVPAFIKNGESNEFGRQLFGDSVVKFLTQKPTYVHCFFGSDRTGGVIARLRTEMGWSCDLAYKEAKSYGFKDIFVDLIDWFSESCDKKPIDTDKIRVILNGKKPYKNPELEQECSLPTPAPDDVPFPGTPGYSEFITSQVPTGILSIPFGQGSHGK